MLAILSGPASHLRHHTEEMEMVLLRLGEYLIAAGDEARLEQLASHITQLSATHTALLPLRRTLARLNAKVEEGASAEPHVRSRHQLPAQVPNLP